MLAFNSTTKITGMWLVEVAAGCDFAVVGVTAMKLLLDAWQLLRAIRRRAHLVAELRLRYTASSDTLLLYLNSSFASGGSAITMVLRSSSHLRGPSSRHPVIRIARCEDLQRW